MDITLYSQDGTAVAYLADEEVPTLYLWHGEAVAYLQGETVYGWNGRHLGWWVQRVLYDAIGRQVGFTAGKCPAAPRSVLEKPGKAPKPFRYPPRSPYSRPEFGMCRSPKTLSTLLQEGGEGHSLWCRPCQAWHGRCANDAQPRARVLLS